MKIQLPSGNTVTVSTYDWLFNLDDKDVGEFLQSCVADELGTYIHNPFSDGPSLSTKEEEEEES